MKSPVFTWKIILFLRAVNCTCGIETPIELPWIISDNPVNCTCGIETGDIIAIKEVGDSVNCTCGIETRLVRQSVHRHQPVNCTCGIETRERFLIQAKGRHLLIAPVVLKHLRAVYKGQFCRLLIVPVVLKQGCPDNLCTHAWTVNCTCGIETSKRTATLIILVLLLIAPVGLKPCKKAVSFFQYHY